MTALLRAAVTAYSSMEPPPPLRRDLGSPDPFSLNAMLGPRHRECARRCRRLFRLQQSVHAAVVLAVQARADVRLPTGKGGKMIWRWVANRPVHLSIGAEAPALRARSRQWVTSNLPDASSKFACGSSSRPNRPAQAKRVSPTR